MLLIPSDKPFDFRQPPKLSLGLALLLLVLFAWLAPLDQARRAELNAYYQQHLLAVEWPLYPTHLLQTQQTTTLARLQDAQARQDYDTLAMQIGADRAFRDSLQTGGQDYLEPDTFLQWQRDRPAYDKELGKLGSQVLGLDPQRFRPITFITHAFVDDNSLRVLASVILLLVAGMAVELALGSGALLTAWLAGSVGAGLVYSLTHHLSVTPLTGSAGALAGVLGLAFMRFRPAGSLTVPGGRVTLGGWLFLAVFLLLEAIYLIQHPDDQTRLLRDGAAFVCGVLVCLGHARWFQTHGQAPASAPVIVHEDMPADELYRHELNSALQKISQMQFSAAERQLRALAEKYPLDKRIMEHLYHLLKFKPTALEFEELASGLFSLPNQPAANHLVLSTYKDYKQRSLSFAALDADTCLQLAMRFARINALSEAEDVFKRSLDSKRPSPLLPKAALMLSQTFGALQQTQRADYYQRFVAKGS